MPFPEHVFRHTPGLRDRITPPDASEMRFGLDRFDELDAQAAEEGWPPGWRMDHAEREANRQSVLRGRFDQDLWVFAYGSLIWDPAVMVEEYRRATLNGWHRAFCMHLEGGRARHDQPGLMLALDEDGTCEGLAFRIAAENVDQETAFMWNREMFSGSYCPQFLALDTPQGTVDALVFVMDRSNPRYQPDLTDTARAVRIGTAEGDLGSNFAYLDALVRHLDELGVPDPGLHHLHMQAKAVYEQRALRGDPLSPQGKPAAPAPTQRLTPQRNGSREQSRR